MPVRPNERRGVVAAVAVVREGVTGEEGWRAGEGGGEAIERGDELNSWLGGADWIFAICARLVVGVAGRRRMVDNSQIESGTRPTSVCLLR